MKALVIADNEKVIESINSSLQDFGYDVIVYRWLLKALDNIEEISPHLIVISTEDYPRHWKTLVQYAASNTMLTPKILLFVGTDNSKFTEDEHKKADALGVFGSFTSENEFSGLKQLLEKIPNKQPVKATQTVQEQKTEEHIEENDILDDIVVDSDKSNSSASREIEDSEQTFKPCSFVFTNPITLALVSGVARNFDGKQFEFSPDIPEFAQNLSVETLIRSATLKVEDEIKSVTASVVSNDSEKIVLKISA